MAINTPGKFTAAERKLILNLCLGGVSRREIETTLQKQRPDISFTHRNYEYWRHHKDIAEERALCVRQSLQSGRAHFAQRLDTLTQVWEMTHRTLLCRSEHNDQRGEWAKVPYSPTTGQRARTHNASGKEYPGPASATWGTFEEAKARYERGCWDGIGFVFSESDPFVGGDIDRCRDASGAFDDTAAFALPFVETYCEISPSGTGVKFIARASMPGGKGRKKNNVELYGSQRYFTLTGHRIEEYPATVEARQGEINTLHEIWFGKDLPKLPERLLSVSPVDDAELLKRTERDPLFNRLWRGDAGGYGSQSSADFALVGKLLFYVGSPDAARVDRLFRQSGLMRAKWDEKRGTESYGERTVRKAIEGRTDYYGQSSGVRYAAVASAIDLAKTGASVPPTFDAIPDNLPEESTDFAYEEDYYTHENTPEQGVVRASLSPAATDSRQIVVR